ncbi:restriction endonuclease [Helicobacter vulpis]|uniref:restriction endonuclease n=1 Tax=Helicobacter vulpis TaxID=2316076 RepID=UPI000EB25670|nr:restriction endonuclease [Helicobacter vulpis]
MIWLILAGGVLGVFLIFLNKRSSKDTAPRLSPKNPQEAYTNHTSSDRVERNKSAFIETTKEDKPPCTENNPQNARTAHAFGDLAKFSCEKPHGHFDERDNQGTKNMQKGSTYEEFIAKKYAKNGYDPIFHRDLGKNDQKIDLILSKGDEVLLIQCKNWNLETGYRVGLDYVKSFLKNCDALEKTQYLGKNCQRLLVLSSPVLEKEAWQFIKDHAQDLRVGFEIIEYKGGIEMDTDYAKKYRNAVKAHYAGEGFSVKDYSASKAREGNILAFTRIHLVLRKDKQIVFVQCINWNPEGAHKVDRKHLEKFLEDCCGYKSHLLRDDYEQYKQCFFKNIVVLNSSKLLTQDAIDFIRSQKDQAEHERVFYEVLEPSADLDKVHKHEGK